MKDIAKLTEMSAKKSFQILRWNWPYFCNILENKEILITNLYFKHIVWSKFKRKTKEKILRLLLIPFINEILKYSEITEIRIKPIIEKKEYAKSYRITIKKNDKFLTLIIAEQTNWKLILISSFLDYKK